MHTRITSPRPIAMPMPGRPRRGWAGLLALWPVAAAAQAAAELTTDEIRRDLYTVENRVSLGLGAIDGDNRRFGQHRGLTQGGAIGLLDLNLVQRDEATGTWIKFAGVRLGQDTGELRFTHERQGDWGYTLQAKQWARHEPVVVNTGLQGLGTGNQVVSATAPKRDVDLKIKHDIVHWEARKMLAKGLELTLNFRHDDATGDRIMGRGTPSVMEFLTEPVDRETRQWQAQLAYASPALQWQGGYSGSVYDNHIPVLRSTGGNTASFSPLWAIALPPSNAAYQLYLSGGAKVLGTGRASLKLSHTVATQNEVFDPVFTRLAGAPESLNGRVVTTLAYGTFHQQLLGHLDTTVTLRHEERKDLTPEARFLAVILPTVGGTFGTAGFTGLYKPRSLKQEHATLDLATSLGRGYRLSGTLELEEIKRDVSAQYRRVSMRDRTNETTVRVDVKRSGSEVFNGGLALLHSQRGGSDYAGDTYDPAALTNQVATLQWSDRSRDKLRGNLDWTPDDTWSVQLQGSLSRDNYGGRVMGPRQGEAGLLSADVLFRANDAWTLTAWASHERTVALQTQRSDRVGAVAAGYDTVWDAHLRYTTRAVGLSVRGKPRARLDIGADLSASHDVADTDVRRMGGAGTMELPAIPSYYYQKQAWKFFADWQLNRQAGVRLELGVDRHRNNDWTWTNWVYNGAPSVAAANRTSDGTTLTNQPTENVAWVGLRYNVRWR